MGKRDPGIINLPVSTGPRWPGEATPRQKRCDFAGDGHRSLLSPYHSWLTFLSSFDFCSCPCHCWWHETVIVANLGCKEGMCLVCAITKNSHVFQHRLKSMEEYKISQYTSRQSHRRSSTQQLDWFLILCARSKRRRTARVLQNDL